MKSFISLFHSSCRSARKPRASRALTLELLEARVQPASSSLSLGAAAQFAVLGLEATRIDNQNVTVAGDEGVSQGGSLRNQRHSTITGNVEEYANGQLFGRGTLDGTLTTDPALLSQADSDARSASLAAAALPPTQTLGRIRTATTITGNGGLNVININGSIHASLTLSGGPADVFIVNVSGTLALEGHATLGLAGGVTADHVLYNFTGNRGTISTDARNTVNGTLLAPNYRFDIAGTVNGEIIGGGRSIDLHGRATVNQVSFTGVGGSSDPGLSGYVYADTNGNGVMDPGESGLPGITVTLTGVDNQGNAVTLTATTDASGFYKFTGLVPGTYSLSRQPSSYTDGAADVGTVRGQTDGTAQGGVISQIVLQMGDQGVNYDFAELLGN
jgi:hypothetical protein